jgi:hypothetical protein
MFIKPIRIHLNGVWNSSRSKFCRSTSCYLVKDNLVMAPFFVFNLCYVCVLILSLFLNCFFLNKLEVNHFIKSIAWHDCPSVKPLTITNSTYESDSEDENRIRDDEKCCVCKFICLNVILPPLWGCKKGWLQDKILSWSNSLTSLTSNTASSKTT